MTKFFFLLVSHLSVLAIGFAVGIYTLPILMAPDSPYIEEVSVLEQGATYTGEFNRDLEDSDFLHWGEGNIYLTDEAIVFKGKLAPGPAYRLYLSPEFVETEAAFEKLRPQMVVVADVDTFENFIVNVPETIKVAQFNSVIIWCESFSQFITAARYR